MSGMGAHSHWGEDQLPDLGGESRPRLEADHPLHWQVMTTPINDWANTMEVFATAYCKSDKPSFISILLIHK